DRADRWYIIAFDSDDTGLFLSISFDGNPLHGFMPAFHLHDAPFPAGFPDYPKPGFNKDAIFISFNDFANNSGGATIVSIDKLAAFTGQLRFFVAVPDFQFRGMPPAQMHDDGDGVEWFVSTDGTDADGTTIRVTQLTNYLSNNPTFTYTHL